VYAEERIPLRAWLVAGLAAAGLHALLLLAFASSEVARSGDRDGSASQVSRLRIALGSPPTPPAPPAPATPVPPVSRKAAPKSLPLPPASRQPAPVPTPRVETQSPPFPNVAAGPMAAGAPGAVRTAVAGQAREAKARAGLQAALQGTARVDYFSALHARVVAVLEYPRRARLADIQGTVVLQIRIDREGDIRNSWVGESSGSRALDRQALRIAKRAAPFGPVPVHFRDADLAFELPVEFALSD